MPTLRAVPEIAIGNGRVDLVSDDVASVAPQARVLLMVADPGLRQSGVLQRVLDALSGKPWSVLTFDALAGEPTASQIDQAAAMARETGAEVVVGVGGGTALDVAKMVGAMAPAADRAEHYEFAAHPFPAEPLPVIAVPTTAGTGSETTITAVFANGAGKKAWAWGPELKAAKAILDPALTVSLPAHLTAATGIDALVHAIEAATNRNRFDANDIACHAAIRLIARHLPVAVAEPGQLAAREGMLLASALAGMGINNSGTAIAHAAAHALGSLGKVHHGRAAGLGLRASLHASLDGNPTAFAAVAEAMGGSRDAAALPDLFEQLVQATGLKVSLAEDLPGLSPERLAEEIAAPENAAMRGSSARTWDNDDLLALARRLLAPA